MEEQDLAAEPFLEMPAQLVPISANCVKTERLVARGHRLFQHLFESGELARAPGQPRAIA